MAALSSRKTSENPIETLASPFVKDVCLPEQHSVRHVLDDGLVGGAVLEADGVAHLLAQQAPELLRHALRHRHGRHPARLGAADLACGRT